MEVTKVGIAQRVIIQAGFLNRGRSHHGLGAIGVQFILAAVAGDDEQTCY